LSNPCVTIFSRWLLAIFLLLFSGAGSGGTTEDYTWLLFLKVNEPPVVDTTGLDQEITWAEYSVYLDATVTDDPRDTLTYAWSKLSGPGSVTFSAPFSEDTTATFTASGAYILQLSANDGKLTSTSTVAITLSNSAPLVNAGTDKLLTYPTKSVFLNATVNDHPRDTLSYSWSKVSGPGSVVFSSSSSEDTNAAFSISGIYTVKLVASDGDKSSSDQVKVTINNSAPTVDAGPSMQTTAPDNSVYLNATVTDSTSGVLTYTWSKVSGPGTALFSNSSAVDTNVSMSAVGTYSFRLRASDGELASTDTVSVVYLSQPVDKIDVIVAVGDSITVGFGDSDCVYQNAKACSGYTPRLKNKLAGTAKYAAGLIIQERGTGGKTSAYGLSVIDSIISSYPYADQYLVMYGTNDAQPDPPPSKSSFKYNMRRIAEKIYAVRGMNPVLAKAPYAKGDEAYRNVAIQLYNQAIQELYAEKSFITISPPDFYTYFKNNQGQIWSYYMFNDLLGTNYTDNLHPKSSGYDAMANMWFNKLK